MSIEVPSLGKGAAQALDRFGLDVAILIIFAGGELDAKQALGRVIVELADNA
jgi:hypothetical protein